MSAEPKRAEIFPGCEIVEGDTVVDVGCGVGDNCVFAGKLGADVIGIEVDPNLIGIIERKMAEVPARSSRVLLSDCNPIPLPDSCADVVICTEVVEHSRDPAGLVAELARIGKPGARYWVSVPDPASEAIMAIVCPPTYFQFPEHINVFGRDRFLGLIEGAGLEVDRSVGVGFYHSFWWVLRMACGTGHCPGSPTPPPPLIARWESLWEELMACPLGGQLARGLDTIMPKSQVVVARKPSAVRLRPGRLDAPHASADGPHRAPSSSRVP